MKAVHFCYWLVVCLAFTKVHSSENGNITDKCQWGVCDQQCVNTVDSHTCLCVTGWILQDDGHSCKPENGETLMIFATKTSIKGYRIESMTNFTIAENLQHVVGVSLDVNYVYWSDIGEKAIFCSFNNGTKREAIVTTGLDSPEDIAVDFITGNIYFTDATYKYIGVCNDNGNFCKILINDTDRPRGIAVMPTTGKLYWTDWGDNAHIAVSYMDGSKKAIFVEGNMGWPNDLTIDRKSDRLYWVNAKQKKIECIGLDGTDRRIILENVAEHPYSVAVFGNRLYWSDWGTQSIHSCNKFTGKNFTTPVHLNETLYGIHIYHSTSNVEFVHPCALKPCSQLCLLAENRTYTCACNSGTELGMDSHTCRDTAKRKHFVIAANNAIVTYSDVVLGKPMNVMSNVTAHCINSLTYDPLKDTLIAVDVKAHSIFRYDLKSNQNEHIESPNGNVIECIAFDYLGNNLYKSYGMFNNIKIYSLNTGEKTEFSYEESPFDMVLIPEEGMMFVVFRSNDSTLHIDRAQMNDLEPRVRVIDQGLVGPKISLAYDKDTNRIFWADEGTGRIESSDPFGQNKILFRDGISSPVSIAVLDSEIFWTSRRSALVSRADKNTHNVIKSFKIEISQQVDTLLLQSVDGFYIRGFHPCHRNNGDCSHVCLVTDAKNRLCACPPNVVLDSDMKTCKTKTSHADAINSNCSNGNFWIGLFVGLLVFITFTVMHYYIKTKKPNFINMVHSRNPFNGILTQRRRQNLASISTSTIESY